MHMHLIKTRYSIILGNRLYSQSQFMFLRSNFQWLLEQVQGAYSPLFAYVVEREKQKVGEKTLMQETSLHTVLDSKTLLDSKNK